MESDSAAYFIWCVCDVCVMCVICEFSVLWRGLMERNVVNPVLIKVAQRTQPKKLAAFTRRLIDYIVYSLPHTPSHDHINKVSVRVCEGCD